MSHIWWLAITFPIIWWSYNYAFWSWEKLIIHTAGCASHNIPFHPHLPSPYPTFLPKRPRSSMFNFALGTVPIHIQYRYPSFSIPSKYPMSPFQKPMKCPVRFLFVQWNPLKSPYKSYLVGGFNPFWKIWQSGGIPQFPISWKSNPHAPNHQPDLG